MSSDLARQVTVTASALACAFGTALGFGLIGTRVEDTAGGVLAADATLIAPFGSAFSIWSVIYLGLLGYVIWQWLPAHQTSPRARSTGWWASASMVLNGAWLVVTQQGWLWVSVAVIIALALVLKVVAARLTRHRPHGWTDRILLDGTFGLYLGWVAVAVCANIAATLVEVGAPATGIGPELATVVVLLAVLALSWLYSNRYGTAVRWPIAAATAWGLGWVAYGRLTDDPSSTLVGVSAALVAAAVLAFAVTATLTTSRSDPLPPGTPAPSPRRAT